MNEIQYYIGTADDIAGKIQHRIEHGLLVKGILRCMQIQNSEKLSLREFSDKIYLWRIEYADSESESCTTEIPD